ncbi:Sorting nexin-13 [Trichoplax sp. H2]|nr:Sorting nexin-13 [Trichoplax sp. H2]|eukprot:RDD40439.1 Sorting nexin-13 [Trichoplax sp. H2]
MEKQSITREKICTCPEVERAFLQDLVEILLYQYLSPDDFGNTVLRSLAREIIVSSVVIPTINILCDPDFINGMIITWMKENSFNFDSFITAIRTTRRMPDITETLQSVETEIMRVQRQDTEDAKHQLNNLNSIKRECNAILKYLQRPEENDDLDDSKQVLPDLPLHAIISNNTALLYFMEYLDSIGGKAKAYLSFWLNIECFRTSAEQQISAVLLNDTREGDEGGVEPDLETLRVAAFNLFDEYLCEQADQQVALNPQTVKKLYENIKLSIPSVDMFDTCQEEAYHILLHDFCPAFKRSQFYYGCCVDLGMVKDEAKNSSVGSDIEEESQNIAPVSPVSDNNHDPLSENSQVSNTNSTDGDHSTSQQTNVSLNGVSFTVAVTTIGVTKNASTGTGKTYAVYAISVTKHSPTGDESWEVYRRYSDFHDLHMQLKEKLGGKLSISLPGKRTFGNNLDKAFLESRRRKLDLYLKGIVDPEFMNMHKSLIVIIASFLEPGSYNKEKNNILRKMDTFVTPFRDSVNTAVKLVDQNLFKPLDQNVTKKISVGLNRVFDKPFQTSKVKGDTDPELNTHGSTKVAARLLSNESIDDDSIPLRILLLLMDEVFDFQKKNQWLERHKIMLSFLKQMIKATYGDKLNRKIIDQVQYLTSSEQIAQYVRQLRDILWPNGVLAEPTPERKSEQKSRARIVALAKMLGSVPDDLRRIIGSETCTGGIVRVFNMFQQANLNKRLFYTMIEAISESVFPETFSDIFAKLYAHHCK